MSASSSSSLGLGDVSLREVCCNYFRFVTHEQARSCKCVPTVLSHIHSIMKNVFVVHAIDDGHGFTELWPPKGLIISALIAATSLLDSLAPCIITGY